MYVCMYVRMYVCMYVCMYVWMYGCMYMYVCMYVQLHLSRCMKLYLDTRVDCINAMYMCVMCMYVYDGSNGRLEKKARKYSAPKSA